MFMYAVNILLLIFYAAILLWIRPSQGKRKAFCIMASTNWILLSGLRHYSVGADTNQYRYAFYNSKYLSWDELFENFRNTIFKWNLFAEGTTSAEESIGLFDLILGENALVVKDPGYAILNKAFYSIIPNYTVFLIFIAILFMVPLAIFIYRYSREPLLSYIIYSTLFYSFFSLTGHRQTIAMSIALIGYVSFANQKKFLPFLLTILIAYPFHKSIIGFLPVYFLQYIKMDRKKIVAVLLMFPIVFIFRRYVANALFFVSGYELEDHGGGVALTFLSIYIILMIVSLWKGTEALKISSHTNNAMVAVAIAFLLTPTTFVNPSMMRLVQYYSFFLILFVPDLIMAFEKDECVFAYFGASTLVLFLMLKNNPQYLFFWQ